MKHLNFDSEHYYLAKNGVDFYPCYKEDIALIAEMGLEKYVIIIYRKFTTTFCKNSFDK